MTIEADAFEPLVRLERLTLGDNRLTTVQPGMFRWLRSLQLLDLHGNEIRSAAAGMFDDTRRLKVVWVSDNRMNCTAGVDRPIARRRASELRSQGWDRPPRRCRHLKAQYAAHERGNGTW